MIKEIQSKIGIIIPTLNEEKSIDLVLNDVEKELKNIDFQIIVVDGKSTDNTVNIAKKHNVHVIFQKNIGYGEALFAGYYYATKELKCEILVTLDADGTYSAKDSIKLISKIDSHDYDYIVGRRLVNSKNMTTSHRFGNKAISWLIRHLLKINLQDTQSGLFAFRSYLMDSLDLEQLGWASNTEMLTKASDLGMVIGSVDISYSPRIGETKGSTISGGLVNLRMIIRMMRDSNPILLQSIFGICLTTLGIIFGLIIFHDFLLIGYVNSPGLALLSALLILAGIQVFSIGLMSDMIKKRQQIRVRFAYHLYYKSENN